MSIFVHYFVGEKNIKKRKTDKENQKTIEKEKNTCKQIFDIQILTYF
jgi:hypothetical protein